MEWNRRLTAVALAAMMAAGSGAAAEGMGNQVSDTVVVATIMTVPAGYAALPGLDSSFLVLPSEAEPLAESYEPQDLVKVVSRRNDADGNNANNGVYTASSQQMKLAESALSALKRMFDAAESQGVVLYLRQGYRSYADEERNTQRMAQRGEVGEVPGQSDWQTGFAVAVVPKELRTKTLTASAFDATSEAKWLKENSASFGFVVRYPEGKSNVTGQEYQPWRLRYVGESAAEYMTSNGLTLEELCAGLNVGGSVTATEPEVVEADDEAARLAEATVEIMVVQKEDTEESADVEEEIIVEEDEVIEEDDVTENEADPDEDIDREEEAEEPESSADGIPTVEARFLKIASAVMQLDASYVPQNLQTVRARRNADEAEGVYQASSNTMQLVDVALNALTEMFGAAEQEGLTLYLRQGYRSYEEEKARYERLASRGKGDDDKPGESDWQTGMAVTVVSKSLRTKSLEAAEYLKTAEGQWVVANCVDYGFVIRYPQGAENETGRAYEPWHLRYVGVDAARYMQDNGLTLEGFRAVANVTDDEPVTVAAASKEETAADDAVEAEPVITPALIPTSTPVPAMLPGGIELVGEGEDGDWEFSLFGN